MASRTEPFEPTTTLDAKRSHAVDIASAGDGVAMMNPTASTTVKMAMINRFFFKSITSSYQKHGGFRVVYLPLKPIVRWLQQRFCHSNQ